MDYQLSIAQCATLACQLEVTIPKPGNVHRGADFDDLTLNDFIVSATAIGPVFDRAAAEGVGPVVFDAVRYMRGAVDTNTHLGTILLLAPLAAVPRTEQLTAGIHSVIAGCDDKDAQAVYEAIQLARPGGLGSVDQGDVATGDTLPLAEAMKLAEDRDLIARQWTNGFRQVLHETAPRIANSISSGLSLTSAVVEAHVWLMSEYPDSLIARKCGDDMAVQSSIRAKPVLACRRRPRFLAAIRWS
ncbi:MAG: triphosphoribosyl-dephospho-CoA synthase [Pirellulaceae bacterium]|jgi:triphosphoribosyl-dephospho-CoA synthase